ncbi:aldo/keto reductase [Monoraphidium neglectum]|uniref:Aldo/keto reductase n=1 Tax=Monoraphidium neglectum TaxID=145388 RepID=A0A0D2K965_9CHLO|nr:aldo/keto reductase [Monoraphidium neglectum]KIZ06733.1 aldo/keto reductase [Monoraphidium neglectum]|eukprot:XP_013905752.1 aldo/keto reductase [Monoraphidium neglectum]
MYRLKVIRRNRPQVIKGTWQLDGRHKGDMVTDRTAGGAAIDDMERFVRAGVTTFDTSDAFGPSEALIGQFRSLSPRVADSCTVLTKLTFMGAPGPGAISGEMIEYRVRAACTRLGVARLPLVQLHWDNWGARGYVDAARHLADLQRRGLVGAVGVCNWDVPRLLELIDAGVTPATNQVSYSVLDRRPGLFLPPVCERHGVKLLAYGTLAGGFIGDRYLGLPANKAKLDTVSKAKYGTWIQQLGGWTVLQDALAVLKRVGRKHGGVSASLVAMRWVLQQPGVAAAVVGQRNALHLADTRRLFTFELDEVDMLDIDAAYEGAQQPAGDVYAWERGGSW